MADWTSPATWADGSVVTAAQLNEQIRDNEQFLYDAINSIVVLQDQKTAGTDGGTFTQDAWQTRTLNTEVVDVNNLCTLAANQFTLEAGTWEILASAPAQTSGDHQARLQNVTDAVAVLLGTSETVGGATAAQNRSHIVGRFTIAASKALEIQHYCLTTRATDGFGEALGITTEVYTTVWLRKVA